MMNSNAFEALRALDSGDRIGGPRARRISVSRENDDHRAATARDPDGRGGIRSGLEGGRIQLVEADLSMLDVAFLRRLRAIVERAQSLDEAKQLLTEAYHRMEASTVRLQLPAGVRAHEAGLVISSDLVH